MKVCKVVILGLLVVYLLTCASIIFMTLNTSLSDTVLAVRSAVVHIEKAGEWEGSGFIISDDGVIVTAKHVVEGGGRFIVTLDNGKKYETTTAIALKGHDVGFLKIESEDSLPFLVLDTQFNIRPGDSVFIMGSPLGKENFNSVTLGIISAQARNLDTEHDYGYGWTVTFQSDAAAYPGNSGGPVFNMDGCVIGVLVAGMDASLNYSVPVFVFSKDMNSLITWLNRIKFEVMELSEPELPQIDYMGMILNLEDQIRCLQEQVQRLEEFVGNTDATD